VSRPGRCAVKTEFLPFSPDEARAWLDRHGRSDLGRSCTLASLYAGDDAAVDAKPRIGFAT
jgi:hypothetical protein